MGKIVRITKPANVKLKEMGKSGKPFQTLSNPKFGVQVKGKKATMKRGK